MDTFMGLPALPILILGILFVGLWLLMPFLVTGIYQNTKSILKELKKLNGNNG